MIRPRAIAAGLPVLFLLLVASDAAAQDGEGPSHRGFFTRVTLGLGASTAVANGIPELALDGAAGFFSFDIGGSLAERLALHARLGAHNMMNPTVSLGGDDLGEAEDTSVSFSTFGLGLTYYFPANLYLTGVVGLAGATLDIAGDEADSERGYSVQADLGYEWAVGGDWGLGLAGRIEHHSIPTDSDRLTATAFGLLFSATYH